MAGALLTKTKALGVQFHYRNRWFNVAIRNISASYCPNDRPCECAIVVPYNVNPCDGEKLFYTGKELNDELNGKLMETLEQPPPDRTGVYLVDSPEKGTIALSPLETKKPIIDDDFKLINMFHNKERIRESVALGMKKLAESNCKKILIGNYDDDKTASEAAYLTAYQPPDCIKTCMTGVCVDNYDKRCCQKEWETGMIAAKAQNLSRHIQDTKIENMKPTNFAETAIRELCCCDVKVEVRDERWMKAKKMTGVLMAAQTTCVEPLFLELSYFAKKNEKGRPLLFVGRGSCLEECCAQGEPPKILSNDYASAAAIVGAFYGAAKMLLPMDMMAYIPIYGYNPMRAGAGSVVNNFNGIKTKLASICNEGCIVMSDALSYSKCSTPSLIMTIDSQPHDARVDFKSLFNVCLTNCDVLWQAIRVSDLSNRGELEEFQGVGHAHAFLSKFIPCCDAQYGHIQIARTCSGVSDGRIAPYLLEGLKLGRPTRSLIELLYYMACPHQQVPPNECCDSK
ncbi:cytosol aminopeptidase-like isoform X3 [Daktulosphaira vitifoliae]|uniref:cytosol aminopeptidase-like isoform X3 n=1 Tax=Daktulosphaira vitifoliae TaxID=58002 RepID=UPI0021AAD3B7|nr:cytosol aminopeptidase-like isoform X3 [Daktulosphaira vitifoliae]